MSEDAIKIFYSYSRKDLDMRNALEDHLSALREAGRIRTWHDLELEAGTEWEAAILDKLDTSDIILLLISSSFIASKYCYGTELKRAIARHEAGTARVIPTILRPCDWNQPDVPFSKLNVLPTHATPITQWEDRDAAFAIVAQKIRETVDQLNAQKQAKQQAEERRRQQLLAQRAAEQKAEQERLQREQQAKEQEKQQQAEQLQRDAEAALRLRPVLERQRIPAPLREEEQRRGSLTRQQFLKWAIPAGVGVVGVGVVSQLIKELFPSSDPSTAVNYSKLAELLQARDWWRADQETQSLMLKVAKREQEGWLDFDDIKNFPCDVLSKIDRLWVVNSNGKFGFNVQKKIYVEDCGGKPTGEYNDKAYRTHLASL